MKCEICRTIEKFGLDPAAHDMWHCADNKSPRLMIEKAHVAIHHFWHEKSESLSEKWQAVGYMPHQRAHYLTLDL